MRPIALADLRLSSRSHISAMWWLSLLYRQPQRFNEALAELPKRQQRVAACKLLLHVLPYLLAMSVVGRGLLTWIGTVSPATTGSSVSDFAFTVAEGFAGGIVVATVGAFGLGIAGGMVGGIAGAITVGIIIAGGIAGIAGPIAAGIAAAGGVAGGIAKEFERSIAGWIAGPIVVGGAIAIGIAVAPAISGPIASGITITGGVASPDYARR